jgi:hypothetical protein
MKMLLEDIFDLVPSLAEVVHNKRRYLYIQHLVWEAIFLVIPSMQASPVLHLTPQLLFH